MTHRDCTHAPTPAARATCRKARAAVLVVSAPTPTPEPVIDDHYFTCTNCGAGYAEDDPDCQDDAEMGGYSPCCNDRLETR